MRKDEYKKLVSKYTPEEPKIQNIIVAFLVGGLIGFIGEFSIYILKSSFAMSNEVAAMWTAIMIVFVSCLLTGMGFFDNLVSKCKCGLILPTTGFAHSVSSSALDYKRDGLIKGVGSNFFKLAGSVILYGIISAFIFVIVRVVISA